MRAQALVAADRASRAGRRARAARCRRASSRSAARARCASTRSGRSRRRPGRRCRRRPSRRASAAPSRCSPRASRNSRRSRRGNFGAPPQAAAARCRSVAAALAAASSSSCGAERGSADGRSRAPPREPLDGLPASRRSRRAALAPAPRRRPRSTWRKPACRGAARAGSRCRRRTGPASGSRKTVSGQPPLAGHRLHGLHVDRVDVRALLAVDLDADEVLVHERRGLGVLEGLALHHVAPVAGGVADREQDRAGPARGRARSASVAPRVASRPGCPRAGAGRARSRARAVGHRGHPVRRRPGSLTAAARCAAPERRRRYAGGLRAPASRRRGRRAPPPSGAGDDITIRPGRPAAGDPPPRGGALVGSRTPGDPQARQVLHARQVASRPRRSRAAAKPTVFAPGGRAVRRRSRRRSAAGARRWGQQHGLDGAHARAPREGGAERRDAGAAPGRTAGVRRARTVVPRRTPRSRRRRSRRRRCRAPNAPCGDRHGPRARDRGPDAARLLEGVRRSALPLRTSVGTAGAAERWRRARVSGQTRRASTSLDRGRRRRTARRRAGRPLARRQPARSGGVGSPPTGRWSRCSAWR